MGEFRAAVIAVAGTAFSLLFAVIAFRVTTPAIIEMHFDGSVLVATLTALVQAGLIIAFTTWWVRLVAKTLRGPAPRNLIEEDRHGEDV